MRYFLPLLISLLCLQVSACSNPQPGPDKSFGGMLLGAGWGAGAGAVVGNQISATGEGAAVGAGFGAVHGAMSGIGYDMQEGAMLDQERALASLKVQNMANRNQIAQLQATLDRTDPGALGGVYQVFFDPDATSFRAGTVSNLEVIARSLQKSPYAHVVHVVGHADDSGSPDHNERLAEARARAVAGFLSAKGISSDQIQVKSFGAKRPIATNESDIGRQLNRRVDIYIDQN